MAEAFLKQACGEEFDIFSAGLEPGTLNPFVVELMKEEGLDISRNATKAVLDMVKSGKIFSYVITVCDETSAERCPIFPGATKRLHWSFKDPSSFSGTKEERLEKTREVREEIKTKIKDWCAEVCPSERDEMRCQ